MGDPRSFVFVAPRSLALPRVSFGAAEVAEACAASWLLAMLVHATTWLHDLVSGGLRPAAHWPFVIVVALATSGAAAALRFRERPGARTTAMWIGIVSTLLYLSTGRADNGGDATSARYAALSLVKRGDLDLTEFRRFYRHEPLPHYLVRVPGHLVSKYSIGPAILAAPVFQAFRWAGVPLRPRHPGDPSLVWPAKIAAALIAGASAAFLYRAASRATDPPHALVVTVAYAAGTTLLSTVSQSLWQHGPAQLCMTAALAIWMPRTPGAACAPGGRRGSVRAFVAGLVASFTLVCRPADLFLVGALFLWILSAPERTRWWSVVGAALPVAFLAAYDTYYFGAPWRMGYGSPSGGEWQGDPLTGLAGILMSPARGLLVYSPIFLFVPFAWHGIRQRARAGETLWWLLLGAVILHLALYSRWTCWWGGWSLAYRMLSDVTPFACLLLLPFLETLGQRCPWRFAFGAALAASIAIHGHLACWEDCGWDRRRNTDHHPSALWDWRHSPMTSCFRGRRE